MVARDHGFSEMLIHDREAMSTKPWTGGEGPIQPGPAGLLDLWRRRSKVQKRAAIDPPGAVLFDMDGLLVDSEPWCPVASVPVATRYGGVFTPEIKARMIVKRLDLAISILIEGLNTPAIRQAGHDELATRLMDEMVQLLASGVPLQPGALELLDALAGAGIPLALVSSSYRKLVDAALVDVGASRFAVTVAGDEVTRGKPDPEPYVTAARRLGVVPARCVVLEDAPAGLASATAAGCACVYVPTFPSTDALQLPERAVQRASLREVDLELLGLLSVHPHSTAARRARG
jgi:HAD superfamily hydrolase (TIGR01509 family)